MIRTLARSDLDAVRRLAIVASAEGFQFLERLVAQMENDTVRIDAADEFFVCAIDHGEIIGVGGVTPDPYRAEPGVGRVRHVYIRPESRRAGIGRALIMEIERRARSRYGTLRLRTDTPRGARFYEAIGYRPIVDPDATHIKLNRGPVVDSPGLKR
ncbi:MAG TPA: GNAT family N-acetyltransferase [Longimicrobiales bacterium]